MRLDMTFTLQFSGQTWEPRPSAAGPPVVYAAGTPPYLWSAHSCGVDMLALNKLINRISFNIQNKQWTEEDRTPELFDILATQFDQEKMKGYGLNLYETAGLLTLDANVGRGNAHPSELGAIGISPSNGFESSLPSNKNNMTIFEKMVEAGYITIDNVTFSQTSGPVLTSTYNDYLKAYVPMNGTSIFYTVPALPAPPANVPSGNPLIQTVTFTVHEYLISPSLSNPYTFNKFVKSYYAGSYPVNVTLDFDTSYFEGMFKNLLPVISVNSIAYPITTVSKTITDASLNFMTFDSSKEIVEPYQRTLYYNLDFQTMNSETASLPNDSLASATAKKSRVVTSNLSSLPPFIMGWVATRTYENNATLLAGVEDTNSRTSSTLSSIIYHPLQNITIQYGAQTDCMLGVQLTWREIVDLTMSVVHNEEYRRLIWGSWAVDVQGPLFNSQYAGNNLENAITSSIVYDTWWRHSEITNGMTFFILPTAKLNFRPIMQSDMPLIPEFNFGSNNYKSLVVEMTWKPSNFVAGVFVSNTVINCQPTVILCTKRVRSIPMDGQGALADERIEYDYINNNDELAGIVDEFEQRNNASSLVNHELQYVGGGFWGDVLSKVRDALPGVARAIRGVRDLTSGREGLLGRVHDYSSKASDVLHALGHGKAKVGRPRRK
jgi:hypothetical protein